ncbi:MAG: T9SS type A sorting domain-containing protein [Bacteroidia bacterium]|nr:T9SS type A sorting domain-containing protein [Bacteroidia bacterium]
MNLKHLTLFLVWGIISLISTVAFAQTGPGGVGTSTNNALWLKADAGTSTTSNATAISFWNDQSGNGVNVTQTVSAQQPSFSTNVMNGFPAILFDNVNSSGANDKLIGPDASVLDNTSGYTFFYVTRPMNYGDAHVIMSKRTSVSVDQSFMLFYYTGNRLFVDIQTTNDRWSTAASYTTATNYIGCLTYNGAVSTSSLRCTFYNEEAFDKNATETSTLVPDNSSPLLIGTTDASDPRPFGGYIAELIIYREALNDARRIIVNNYLSAKYNISLSANDKYAGDNSGNGDYDRDVTGVGQESSGSNTSFSASVSGGLSLSVNSGLDNGDYILTGHAVATNSTINTDVGGMTGTSNARWQRIWYADVTNTLTSLNVNLAFDMSDGGMPTFTLGTVSNYVLLYRAGTSGNWTELATASSISGDNVIFSSITFTADGYYTIGTRNYGSSPLPIELIRFSAKAVNKDVDLFWSTASERNNQYFIPERSADGFNFTEVCKVKGGGNSSVKKDYSLRDREAYPGLSYYRLKQTDSDGKFTYSNIVAVEMPPSDEEITLYPNPNSGEFFIKFGDNTQSPIYLEIEDLNGRLVYSGKAIQESERIFKVSLKNRLEPATYILKINTGNKIQSLKFIVD